MGIRIEWSWIVLFIIVVIVLYILAWVVLMFRAEANCLVLGFPNSTVVWDLKSYCVSLYDAKPVVIPLR